MSIDSVYKLLEYVNRVSKVPLIVNGELFGHPNPSRVTLKKSFFLKDSCTMCGKCCPNETTAWTKEGYNRLLSEPDETFIQFELTPSTRHEVLQNLQETSINVNGNPVTVYVYPADNHCNANRLSWPDRAEVERCHWLFEKDGTHRCSIHPIRSVTCGLPHVRFIYVPRTNHTTIGVREFGRNFRLKCPVVFNKLDEQDIQTKLLWLKRLNACAKDFGVPTFLPSIIQYLENGGRQEVTFYDIPKRKLF